MKKLKRVVIKEELVELVGDFRPAIILNQFIYWTERMFDTDKYIREEKERALKNDTEIDIEESCGWIYKTSEELNEELMVGMSVPTIRKYIKQLVEVGYITQRRNPKYKWDKTMQYRVDMYKVQKELGKLGYALEGYKLLPNIEIIEEDDVEVAEEVEINKNKKVAPTPTETTKTIDTIEKNIDTSIIHENQENRTSKILENEKLEKIAFDNLRAKYGDIVDKWDPVTKQLRINLEVKKILGNG